MTSIADTARATSERYDLFAPGVPTLAMVSGGGDSVALLRLLASGEIARGLDLSVLHVNHLLRGDESDADARFVAELCDELGVPFRVVRYDVAAFAEAEGLNLEDAGRRIRYRFAEEELDLRCDAAAVPRDLGRIVTAHTLDDRLETFLMRLVAGAGAGGLASIAAVRGRVVRPLLECARDDIREWLRAGGYAWREDPSNSDAARTRARIRAELLPELATYNPRVREALTRTIDTLAEEDALLGELSAAFVRDFAESVPGAEVRFERAAMLTLSRPMRRRTVRGALLAAFPQASRLDAAHVDAISDGLADDAFARDLPYDLRAFTEYGTLVVSLATGATPALAPTLLELPGAAELGPAGTLLAERTDSGDRSGHQDSVVVSADGISGPLTIDSARPGDRMRPLGMEGSRKLSDMLVDAKVPKRERGVVPVVRDAERIVWLAGVRMSDDYRITDETKTAVRLTWKRHIEEEPHA